ncbi:hypothetical protein [Myxococcus sp. Y35]|uniref:hypothetical protein n=1 Tax=Pseudomyxococcus flavus TaxID=3115648 RepID=UPI003CF3834E
MTGDGRPYGFVSRKQVNQRIGDTLEQDLPVTQVVDELQLTYEPFVLIPDLARRRNCERDWRELLGDRVICLEDPTDTVEVAAGLVGLCEGAFSDLAALARHLKKQDLSRQRLGAVIRALTPFAATLGWDGIPPARVGGRAAAHERRQLGAPAPALILSRFRVASGRTSRSLAPHEPVFTWAQPDSGACFE